MSGRDKTVAECEAELDLKESHVLTIEELAKKKVYHESIGKKCVECENECQNREH